MNNQNQLPASLSSSGEPTCKSVRNRRAEGLGVHSQHLTWTSSQLPPLLQYNPPILHNPTQLGFGTCRGPPPAALTPAGLQPCPPNALMAMSNPEQFDFGPGTNPQYEPAQWTGHVRSYPNYQQPAMTTPWMDSHIYQPSYRSTTMNNPQQFVTGNNAHPLPPRPAPAWPDSQPQSLDHSATMNIPIQHVLCKKDPPPPPSSPPPPPPPLPPPIHPPICRENYSSPPANRSPRTNNSKQLGTPSKDMTIKRGPGAARCANCRATSHRLERCLGPLLDGMLPGCPHHNSITHSFE